MPRQEVDCGSVELSQLSYVSQNSLYCTYWIREGVKDVNAKWDKQALCP